MRLLKTRPRNPALLLDVVVLSPARVGKVANQRRMRKNKPQICVEKSPKRVLFRHIYTVNRWMRHFGTTPWS
ncbi:hypothetical protein ALQ36_101879 [Pseudomonas syringae pv. primulae]|uniref:Uncharacterized protein n=1 Tax=Pseudomonas syringae pv. primulae TaxID=251707 RepID=A0A3M3XH69_9PSED|nr:hypothetical protein ALQ36_101879 [Pseudomonas syringae pv. primulae]RMU34161.1 hypothetical protein ALP30_102052 [Pseudomonas syringae pv. primulae]